MNRSKPMRRTPMPTGDWIAAEFRRARLRIAQLPASARLVVTKPPISTLRTQESVSRQDDESSIEMTSIDEATGTERTAYWAAPAWTELTGYVEQAVADGGTLEPRQMLAYMVELRRRYRLIPTEDTLLELLRAYPRDVVLDTDHGEYLRVFHQHEDGYEIDGTVDECGCAFETSA